MTALTDQPRRRRPKDIGTAAETAVVGYLRNNGFPHAERRALAGAYDLGDIVGCPGLVIECKGGKAAETASDAQVGAWLAETSRERDNADADYGVLVMKRKACGNASVGRWWAVVSAGDLASIVGWSTSAHRASIGVATAPVRLTLADLTSLLRAAGYGTPEVAA